MSIKVNMADGTIKVTNQAIDAATALFSAMAEFVSAQTALQKEANFGLDRKVEVARLELKFARLELETVKFLAEKRARQLRDEARLMSEVFGDL